MNRTFLSMTATAAIGVFLGNVAVCSSAHAQSWLPDRQYTEGPGIRAGVLEIHPGVAVRGGYDTNVFKADGETGAGKAGQEIVGAGMVSVSPHVNISTKTAQRQSQGEDRGGVVVPRPTIAFRGGLSATYLHYFQEDAPKNVDVDTDLWLGILPERPVNLELSASYQRSTRPFTQAPDGAGNNTFANNQIRPGARLNVGSASQVLTGYAGYSTGFSIYESGDFDYLNSNTHSVDGGAAWKFLPHTALLYDANLSLQNYTGDTSGSAFVLLSDSKVFKTRLGVNGALTSKLTLRLMGGYAAGFYTDRRLNEFEDVIGEAVLGLKFGTAHKLEVGYHRDVQSAALGGWMRTDRGSAALDLMLASMFGLRFEAGYGYAVYGRLLDASGTPLGADGTSERKDQRIDGAIRAEYRATNWLAFMADATATATITDFDYSVAAQGTPLPDPAGFVAFQFFAGARAHY